uniref:Uncharacterized protein n=1 Tax=Gouania willdenowi TaxID=441366 RepID=A0A8C5ELK6_GOUWI
MCFNTTTTQCNTPLYLILQHKGFCCTSKGFCCTSKGFCCTSKGFCCTSKGFCCNSKGFCCTSKGFCFCCTSKGFCLTTSGAELVDVTIIQLRPNRLTPPPYEIRQNS